MVRTNRHFPENRQNGSVDNLLFDEKRPLFSIPTDDKIDELIAGLTNLPDIAEPDVAQPDGAARDVAAADVAAPDVAAEEPVGVRLPSVEEFRFDAAAAKCMASKLAPAHKARSTVHPPQHRSPSNDRWRFPDEPADESDVQNAWHDADERDLEPAMATPRGRGRGLYWSLCAGALIVTGTSAAFGFVQPLNDLLPERVGNVLSAISDDLGVASVFDRADRPADIAADINVSGDGVASDLPLLITTHDSGQPMATAAAAPTPTTPPVATAVRPSTTSKSAGRAAKAGWSDATAERPIELGITVLKLGAIEGAAAEFRTPELAAADQGRQDFQSLPALQQPVKADPPAVTARPATADEPVASLAQPAASSPPAAQIDRLLARAEDLLQNGDIASARLLFQRVAAKGDRRGAKGMGKTYDPDVYARLPVTGLTPDREQAEIWYKKAGETPTLSTASKTVAEAPSSKTVTDAGAGKIVADARKAVARKPQKPLSAERIAACASKYNSFDPRTGLYKSFSGVMRRCRLP